MKYRKPPVDIMEQRLSVLGRAHLEAAGFTDQTIRKAYARVYEALDAVRVKDFQYQGDIFSAPARVDHETRVRAAELVTKLADHHPARIGVEFDGAMRITSDEELVAILASLGSLPAAVAALPSGGA